MRYLQKIKLKSVLTLVPESMPENVLEFYESNNITLYQFGVPGNKEPFVDIPEDKIALAVAKLLDCATHPILVHCNKGKHRTGCLIGCLRKIQHWSHISICEECVQIIKEPPFPPRICSRTLVGCFVSPF